MSIGWFLFGWLLAPRGRRSKPVVIEKTKTVDENGNVVKEESHVLNQDTSMSSYPIHHTTTVYHNVYQSTSSWSSLWDD